MRFLIKFPTRARPKQFLQVLETYLVNIARPEQTFFEIVCDEDDLTMNSSAMIETLQQIPNLQLRFGPHKSKIEAINSGFPDNQEYEVLLLASDDMIPVKFGYDEIIRQLMTKVYPDTDGVLWFNDGYRGSDLNTLVIAGRKYLNRFGYIYHPDYKSFFCDDEFTQVASQLGRHVYIQDVIISHEHPGNTGKKRDILYETNHVYFEPDRQTFTRRKLKNFELTIPSNVNAKVRDKRRCAFVNTFYPEFLNNFFNNPKISQGSFSYAELLRKINAENFGDSDFYSEGLNKSGWEAIDIICNCEQLAQLWCREKNISFKDCTRTLIEQIKSFEPDVVYIQDLARFSRETLDQIRECGVKILAGQIAITPSKTLPIESYDVIFSSIPELVDYFRSNKVASYLQFLAAHPRCFQQNKTYLDREIDVSFVGGITSSIHKKREEFLSTLSKQVPLQLWGYGTENIARDSMLLKHYRGVAWGKNMFSVLENSKISLNLHALVQFYNKDGITCEVTNSANNMRLFEATAAGSLLITDYKNSLDEIFTIGSEVVCYTSADECASLVKYYLYHPFEAQKIAEQGKQKTLSLHTYENRCKKLSEHLHLLIDRKQRLASSQILDPHANASTDYKVIRREEVTNHLVQAWKSPSIPVSQRSLVDKELSQMYQGIIPAPYRVLGKLFESIKSNNMSVLELGCSSGYYYEILEYLLKCTINYTGVDYSSSMIDLAKKIYTQPCFLVEDGASLSFKDKSFDIVISSGVLLHVLNYAQHIKETTRVAKNTIIAHRTPITKNRPTLYSKKKAYGVDCVELCFNEVELLSIFSEYGFILEDQISISESSDQDIYVVSYRFAKL
jgi:SAM-dependent methyltransferase